MDPVVKPYESGYASLGNNPIWLIDINGADTSKNNSENDKFTLSNAPKDAKVGDKFNDVDGTLYSKLDDGEWYQDLEGTEISSKNTSTTSTSNSFNQALRNSSWTGIPKDKIGLDIYYANFRRAYGAGYMPYTPAAMGISFTFNFTGLASGYAGSINIGFVGNDFGIWYTGGPNYGTWNTGFGLSGFMSEWHGTGKPTLSSYMGAGDAYGVSIALPLEIPLTLDGGFSRGFNEEGKTVWKTVSGGLSIANPKLPGKIGVSYQPKTYSVPIFSTSK